MDKEYYSATKNEILAFVTTWIDLEDVQSEMSQAKKKYHKISFLCGIKTRQKTDRQLTLSK